jgi:hypothetical protein
MEAPLLHLVHLVSSPYTNIYTWYQVPLYFNSVFECTWYIYNVNINQVCFLVENWSSWYTNFTNVSYHTQYQCTYTIVNIEIETLQYLHGFQHMSGE